MKKINDLLKLIEKHDQIKVTALEKESKIPRTSLLRYLKELEADGKITKIYGEVALRKSSIETNAMPRLNAFKIEKLNIAKRAAKKIKDGDVIFLDAGSSTYFLAKELFEKDITIYTNNILLSNIINGKYKPKVYFLSGQVNHKTLSISSAETVYQLKNKKFDKSFIGFNSFNEQKFYTTNQEEAILKKVVLEISDKSYLIGRSQKLEEKAKFFFGNKENCHIITEKREW